MSNVKHIAFFDSGVGGLTVLSEAVSFLPSEHYIYYADADNVPYGTKSNAEIQKLVEEAVAFLVDLNLKAIVIACNTATSVVVHKLRKKYSFPIIGMEPAVKPATEITTGQRVLVCATDKTIEEDKLKHLIINLKAQDQVDLLSLQELVTAAENYDFGSEDVASYVAKKFETIDWSLYKAIVLGCTHFLFFKSIFRSIIPEHVAIVDGNIGTVRRLASLIKNNSKENTDFHKDEMNPIIQDKYAQVRFYRSGKEIPLIYYDNYLRLIDEINS